MTTSARGYTPDRFARAVRLVLTGRVVRRGGGQFRIAGNVEPTYDVDLAGDPPCYCRDMENRGRAIKYQCKHVLASRLAGLDPALLQAFADRLDREAQAAEKKQSSRRPKEPAHG